jgi:hypothetical protein
VALTRAKQDLFFARWRRAIVKRLFLKKCKSPGSAQVHH